MRILPVGFLFALIIVTDLFSLKIERPNYIPQHVIEVSGRINAKAEEISEGKHVQFEHRMLGTYFNTFANNGYMIEQVIEKPVESDIPMLLITVCRKLLS